MYTLAFAPTRMSALGGKGVETKMEGKNGEESRGEKRKEREKRGEPGAHLHTLRLNRTLR